MKSGGSIKEGVVVVGLLPVVIENESYNVSEDWSEGHS